MASAGFEPANFGTKGQHATSRPPKPLSTYRVENEWILVTLDCCDYYSCDVTEAVIRHVFTQKSGFTCFG